MAPRLLLDTPIVLRWLAGSGRLSSTQLRELRVATRRGEPVAISDVTLLELAVWLGRGSRRVEAEFGELFAALENSPSVRVLPVSFEIAAEVALLGSALRDPADRAIVATARVHRLQLVTSDQRIVESRLVSVLQ